MATIRLLLKKAVRAANVGDMGFHKKQIEEYTKLKDEVCEEILRLTKGEIEDARKYAESVMAGNGPLTGYILHLYLSPDGLYRLIADTIHSWRLYRYGELFFISAPENEIELSFYEWKDGKIISRRILESELCGESEGEDDYGAYFDGQTFINPERIRQEQKEREEKRKKSEEERRRKRRRFKQYVAAQEGAMAYGDSFFSPQAHRDIKILKQEYRKLVKQYHPDAGGDARDVEIMLMVMNERADILERMEL